MTPIARPTARSLSLLLAGVVSLFTSGCATGELLSARIEAGGVKYAPQDCVEDALRNGPDPAGVRDGMVAFAEACQAGEAASCSVLGVMYELGRGFPADTSRAVALYGAACDAHNARACRNLGALVLGDGSRAGKPDQAVSLRTE